MGTILMNMEMIYCTWDHLGSLLKYRYMSRIYKDSVSVSLMWAQKSVGI